MTTQVPLRRSLLRLGASCAAAASLASTTAATSGRIVSIGDLHGDFDHALALLRAAGLAEEAQDADPLSWGEPPFARYRGVRWTGGDATLVQTGDLVDRGTFARDLYALFSELRRQAALAGGRVVNLIGNHELMNLIRDLRYVSAEDYKAFGGQERRRLAFSDQGEVGRELLDHYQALALLGDTLFVHAGAMPQHLERGVAALNAEARQALREATVQGRRPRGGLGEQLLGSSGPFWVRRLADKPESDMCSILEETLRLAGARRMVVGHTQVEDGRVRPKCGGKLLMADTIISQNGYPMCWRPDSLGKAGCAGSLSFLEFEGPDAFAKVVVTRSPEPAGGEFRIDSTKLPSPPPAPGAVEASLEL